MTDGDGEPDVSELLAAVIEGGGINTIPDPTNAKGAAVRHPGFFDSLLTSQLSHFTCGPISRRGDAIEA